MHFPFSADDLSDLLFSLFLDFALALVVFWILFGYETLRVIDGDLEWRRCIGPFCRKKIFDGAQIRQLAAVEKTLVRGGLSGAIRFKYGVRTYTMGYGLDVVEGEIIVDWLEPQLPLTVHDF